MSTIRFFYDIVCPFAYVASRQVGALASEAGVAVEYKPVLLGGILNAVGSPAVPMDAMNQAKLRLTVLDAYRQASMAGVPLDYPKAHPMRTVATMRVLLAVDGNERVALTDALYRAYWVDGRDVADRAVLQQVVAPFDLDVEAINADPAIKQALFDATDEAVALGAFGVPTFEVGGRFFWGADRMHLVRQALGLPDQAPPAAASSGHRLAFFHDFSSPFSYLASTQVERIAREQGATLERVPFLLGALFKAIGTPIVPIDTFAPARRAYQLADMQDWARWWGVVFRFPSHFPLRTVTALRVAIAEPAATDAIYRAAWAEDRDVSQPDVLHAVLSDAGFDGQGLLERTQEPAVKQKLFANTERAQRIGACGAPTMVVDDTHLFWGQDRLPMVVRALGGWQPPIPPP